MKEELKNIGEVSVKLVRVLLNGTRPGGAHQLDTFKPAIGSSGVPEKALKGRAMSNRAT